MRQTAVKRVLLEASGILTSPSHTQVIHSLTSPVAPALLQVQSQPPPDRAPDPGDVCNHESAVEVVPPLGTDQPGEPAPEKRGIRDVQVSMALMDEFLK